MRRTGRTFRGLLQAIMAVSMNDDKNGVLYYVANYPMVKEFVTRTVGLLDSQGIQYDLSWVENRFTFPNGKVLQFRSMNEDENRTAGLRDYDKMADHYVPDGTHFDRYVDDEHERKMRLNNRGVGRWRSNFFPRIWNGGFGLINFDKVV